MVTNGKLRLLLVDDHDLFRKGLAALLSSRPAIEVVGEAENGQQAIQTREATHAGPHSDGHSNADLQRYRSGQDNQERDAEDSDRHAECVRRR